ncbi:DUF806 family protein [Lactobacillus amylolyticus]|uniref:DUF806 family protein n=1 Tax=Lactobacillus amylolyticus TaxID=83683 RepID=UPI002492FAD5|nr:DUF806 family protein [Lactobacillus amylolyticus]
MDLPVVQAADVLTTANFSWIDNIYTGSIPSDVVDNTTDNIVLFTETVNEPIFYANGIFKGWQIGVEMQIFYSLNPSFNLQDAEISVAKSFAKSGWLIDQSKNRIKDPDTKQWTKVFYFIKNIRGGI